MSKIFGASYSRIDSLKESRIEYQRDIHLGTSSGIWQDHGIMLCRDEEEHCDNRLHLEPTLSPSRRYVVLFDGKLDQPRGDRHDERCSIRAHQDSLRLAKLWDSLGQRATATLSGQFVAAIWDRQEQSLTLMRDATGRRPLYYSPYLDLIVFGSDIRKIASTPWVNKRINQRAVGLLLAHHLIPAPNTIFEGVYKLEANSFIKFKNSKISTTKIQAPTGSDLVDNLPQDIPQAADMLDRRLEKVLATHVRKKDSPGVFLSGGIDSTLIAAKLSSMDLSPIHSLTIAFSDTVLDESQQAAWVADKIGTEQHFINMSPNLVYRGAVELSDIYDEPLADPSAIPYILMAQAASRISSVFITGDGGDEYFGGYNRYRRMDAIPGKRLIDLIDKCSLIPSLPYHIYRHARTMGSMPLVNRLIGGQVPLYPSSHYWKDATMPWSRRAMLTDMRSYLPDQLITKMDRAMSRYNIETVTPLLAREITGFALQLSDCMVKQKIVLKELLRRYLPDYPTSRPKKGFQTPFDSWLRKDLRELFLDATTKNTLLNRGISDPLLAQSIIREHLLGHPRGNICWPLFVLCIWNPDLIS